MELPRALFHAIRDAGQFGPAVWLRKFGPNRLLRLNISGLGHAYIRTRDSDFLCFKQVFSWKEYDLSHPPELGRRIQARYDELVAGGETPIIVDAGANIGAASLWFASQYPAAAVVAVEPDPENVAVLRRNVANQPNVRVLEAAIGSERGRVELVPGPKSWDVQTVRSETGVKIVTVDDAIKASGGDAPFIIKVDIEGFEADLFARNLSWLDRSTVVMIEPHDWMLPGKKTSSTFQRAMGEREFEVFIRGENLFYVRP